MIICPVATVKFINYHVSRSVYRTVIVNVICRDIYDFSFTCFDDIFPKYSEFFQSKGMPFGDQLENQNPTLYLKTADRSITEEEYDDSVVDDFDQREIFGKMLLINNDYLPMLFGRLDIV